MAAKELLRDSFAAAAEQVSQFRDKNRRRAWLVRNIRERASKTPPLEPNSAGEQAAPPPSSPQENGLLGKVSTLPEPDRSAFALFHCLDIDPEEIGELIGLRGAKFGEALHAARHALVPDRSFPASALLSIHRSWGADAHAVAKAVRVAEKKPAIQGELAAQVEFDRLCHTEIENVPMPGGLTLPEFGDALPPGWRMALRQPAVLAIGIALLVMLGVGVYMMIRRLDDFPGKDSVSELVADANEMNGSELEQVTPIEVGKLGDWFMLKGYEDYAVPAELARAKAVGCRVYKHDGHSVAQVALDQQNAILFVFRASDMKVTLNTLTWRIFQQDDWAVATRGDGQNCYIVAFLGDSDDMKGFLRSVGR